MGVLVPLRPKDSELTIDQKWSIAKDFYEYYYRNSFSGEIKFRFHEKPSDQKVEELYKAMLTCTEWLGGYYTERPDLAEKLATLRGEIAIK